MPGVKAEVLCSKIGDDTTVETMVTKDVVHISVIHPHGGFGTSIPHDAAMILAVQLVAHMQKSEWQEVLTQAQIMNEWGQPCPSGGDTKSAT